MLCGYDDIQTIDVDRMAVMGSNEPGGTSIRNMLHWQQLMDSGEFGLHDFGPEGNLEFYGTETAPLYDCSKLKERMADMPIYLAIGDRDMLANLEDFE